MEELGGIYIMLLIMLLFSAVMDGVTLFNILVKHSDDAIEYAEIGLKWIKIVLVFFFSMVMFYYAFTVENTAFITIAEFALGVLLLADGVFSSYVKTKYRKKKKKK